MNWRIGELLVRKKLISWEQLEEVLEEQKKTGELTGEILIRKKYVAPYLFYKVLAEKHLMQFIDIKRTRVNPAAIEAVPQSIAEKFKLLPLEISDDTLIIAISNPLNMLPDTELKNIVKVTHLRTVLCMPSDIEEGIREFYGRKKTPTAEAFS